MKNSPQLRLRRGAAIIGAGIIAAFSTPFATGVMDSTTPTHTEKWDTVRTDDALSLEITQLESPRDFQAGQPIRMTAKVTNTSSAKVNDLQVTARRGSAVESTAEGRAELASGEFPFYGKAQILGTLAPGESRELKFFAPTGLGEESTLAITEPGVYPLMLTLTGSQDDQPANFAEERFLFPVGNTPATDAADAATMATAEEDPSELTVVYPISAQTDILPAETGGEDLILGSEELAKQLAPNGRLSRLLDTYLDYDLQGAGCVALDPGLINTVERMSNGYTVNDSRPAVVQKPKRLRDSWSNSNSADRGRPGAGADDARAWLDRLKEIDCTVAMPWANSDPNAVLQTDNGWLQYEALERGAETIEKITGSPVTSPVLAGEAGYTTQETPLPIMVADNTTWPGEALAFDSSLAALAAQTGSRPFTVGYSDPSLRWNFADDSERLRSISAAAGLRLAMSPADGEDVVAKLPNYLDVDPAREFLATAEALLAPQGGIAKPRPLADVPLERSTDEPTPTDELNWGSPYKDNTAFSQQEIQRVAQQARYTDALMRIMVNDPNISLTRYGFTLPLRRDLLFALSMTGRGSIEDFSATVAAANQRLDKHSKLLRELRESVSLIPPGNVFTRVSESSPLLIVAENRLPLPVMANVLYKGPEGARLNTPAEIRIPAHGSITVTSTASLPKDMDRTTLRLWLATLDGETISQPISIAVQTRAGIVGVYGIGILAALALIFALIFRAGRKKKKMNKER